jgi:YihY family inner membrane protein
VESILELLERLYLAIDQRLGGRLSLLVRTALAFDRDDGALLSRSIAYYALFSLFPLMLVLMSFSSSILDTREAQQVILDLVERYLPASRELIEANIDQVLRAQGTIGVLALLSLFWSASGVFTAMYRAVNRAWGNPKSELFWTEKLYGLAVVIVVGLFLIATTVFSTLLDLVQSWHFPLLGWDPFSDPQAVQLWSWLSAILPPLISVVTFIILYRTIPRNRVTWREVWLGGLVAGLIWEAARRIYTWYLASFARYSLIYGSVGAIIGFLLWSYLSAMILLLGAEFTAQYSHWRKAGRPLESRPLRQWLQGRPE